MSRRRQPSRASSMQPDQPDPAPAASVARQNTRGRSRTPAGMASNAPVILAPASSTTLASTRADPPTAASRTSNPLDAPSFLARSAAAAAGGPINTNTSMNVDTTANAVLPPTRLTLFDPFAPRQPTTTTSRFTSSFLQAMTNPTSFLAATRPSLATAAAPAAPVASTSPITPVAFDAPQEVRASYDPDEEEDDDEFAELARHSARRQDNSKFEGKRSKRNTRKQAILKGSGLGVGVRDTTGPLLSGMLPTTSAASQQGNHSSTGDPDAGIATQIWRRGMGILRHVEEDSDGGIDDDGDGEAADDEDGEREQRDRSRSVKRLRIRDSRTRSDAHTRGRGPASVQDESFGNSSITPTQASALSQAARTVHAMRAIRTAVPDDVNTTGPLLSIYIPPAPAHTRTNTVGTGTQGPSQAASQGGSHAQGPSQEAPHTRMASASGTGTSVLTRADSAVSQFPPVPGIPESFEGLSGIGGQNELGVSQFEESLPVIQYNSRSNRTIPEEDYGVGFTFNPAEDLADPIESQIQAALHSDIIYNRSGNPLTRSSGEPLLPEDDDVLGPLLRTTQNLANRTTEQNPSIASTSGAAAAESQSSTSSSQRRKKRFGSYDPADDAISFGGPPDWKAEAAWERKAGETTGLQYKPLPPQELEARVQGKKKRLFEDDVEGNLNFGGTARSQGVLDRHVQPVESKRPMKTTGPSIGDDVSNPIVMDDAHERPHGRSSTPEVQSQNVPSPTWDEDREASKVYIRAVIRPDRRHRASVAAAEAREAEPSDGEEVNDRLGAVGAGGIEREGSLHVSLAQLPRRPSTLIYDETTDEEGEGEIADPGPGGGGRVLVPNSTQGSEVADDSLHAPPAGGEVPAEAGAIDSAAASNSASASASLEQPSEKLGGWKNAMGDEEELDESMAVLFPQHEVEALPPPLETPIGRSLAAAKKKSEVKGKGRDAGRVGVLSSAASFISEGESLSKKFPPNQQGVMKRKETSSDFWLSSEDPSQASKKSRVFPTPFTLARTQSDQNPVDDSVPNDNRPSHISRYPQPDGLSLSTENSVMRSQLFSSKIAAYNADQAGLKPGDEGYSEPAENDYQRWIRANPEGFSDFGSPRTAPTEKGKAPAKAYAGAFVRMPGSKSGALSDINEVPRVADIPGASQPAIIPGGQEGLPTQRLELEPVIAAQKPPIRSTKTKDPRRRPLKPPTAIVATSLAETSGSADRSSQPSQASSGTDRLVWQSSFASKPYAAGTSGISIGMLNKPIASTARSRASSDGQNKLVTPPPLAPLALVQASPERSDGEAQIEADLIPETQYSQRTSRTSSPELHSSNPQSIGEAAHQPTVLVRGTASVSQVSSTISREPSSLQQLTPIPSVSIRDRVVDENYAEVMANVGGRNETSPGYYGTSYPIQEGPFGLSGIGGQNDFPVEIAEYAETSKPSEPVSSFELPDPTLAAAAAPFMAKKSSKRKRVEEEEGTETDVEPQLVTKKARKVPTAPAPLPAKPEPIRRTRSSTKAQETLASLHGPMTVPQPPPRPPNTIRSRKQTATPRTPSPQPRLTAQLHTIAESSPLSPRPARRQETASPARRPKSYLKGRTLVLDSSTSTVGATEPLGMSDEQVNAQTSASQDPFKGLAKSVNPAKPSKRHASVASRGTRSKNIGMTTKTRAPPMKTAGKRTRADEPEDDVFSASSDISPSPSKKQRGDASRSKTTKTNPAAAPSKAKKPRAYSAAPSTEPATDERPYVSTRVPSTSYTSCRQGGRVFAPWSKHLYTGIVSDSWLVEEDEGDITMCQVDFDDGSTTRMPLTKLYRCELRAGDELRVPGKNGKKLGRIGHVSAVPSWEDRGKVSVRVQAEPVEEVLVMEGKDIAVTVAVVKKKWADRKAASLEDIGLGKELIWATEEWERKLVEATKARGRPLPTAAFLSGPRWKDSPPPKFSDTLPSRGVKRPPPAADYVLASTSRKRRRLLSPPPSTDAGTRTAAAPDAKPFTGHSFIIALGFNGDKRKKLDRDTLKAELTDQILELGGMVIDGFERLLKWGGQVGDDASRWVWEAGDLQYIASGSNEKRGKRGMKATTSVAEPSKLFLIADGASRHSKYLMALAAGIPCIDRGWIDEKGILPWRSYLLPAGHCDSLGHMCSQWTDQAYTDHPRTLESLLEEPHPVAKPLDNKSILFVYPSRFGSDIDEDELGHTYANATLACLMGSSRVEVVHDLKAASLRTKRYDAIVYEADAVPKSLQKSMGIQHGGNVICAGFGWVSDCLITGSYLRLRDM